MSRSTAARPRFSIVPGVARQPSALVRFSLISIVAAGAALRFWNITAGLPYRIGVDEPIIAGRALNIMKTGNFNPQFFDYPGLYIYTQVLIGCARFISGAMDEMWRSLDQFNAEDLFLWTRSLNALLGTITLVVLYRAGLRWGTRVALLAAGLLAVWPNHIRESHFALTDVPLTLLTTATLVLSFRAFETARLKWFLWAGACAGLAASTKYTGALTLVMPLIAAAGIIDTRQNRLLDALASIGAAAAAFLAGSPYTLLDMPAFLNSFGALAKEFRPRTLSSGLEVYARHLQSASGWTGLVTIGAAFVWAGVRAVRDRNLTKWALVIVFPILHLYLISTKNLVYARYLLPALPFICLLVAIALVDLIERVVLRLRQPRWVRSTAAILVVAVIWVPVAVQGFKWPKQYGRATTQDVAYKMIRNFIPAQSTVAVERSVIRLPDSLYHTINVNNLTERSLEEYVSSGVRFFIASSDAFDPVLAQPAGQPDAYRAYRRLLDEAGQCLPTVSPTPTLPGPQIRICRLRID